MRRTVVGLLASLMATAAFGLDLRLVSPATIKGLDDAGNALISFFGVNLRYPNSSWNDTLHASAENTMLTYALTKADGLAKWRSPSAGGSTGTGFPRS